MNKIERIKDKYESLLEKYKKQYSFNPTIEKKFEILNPLFIKTFMKQVNKKIVVIEKRDEFDLMRGISGMISGEFHKSKALNFENKYKKLFMHRDKVIENIDKYKGSEKIKFKPKLTRDPLKIEKPEYGYHIKDPKFPLLEDKDYFF